MKKFIEIPQTDYIIFRIQFYFLYVKLSVKLDDDWRMSEVESYLSGFYIR